MRRQGQIGRGTLKRCKLENLQRLARYLRLDYQGMSVKQLAGLIHWRITRNWGL